MASIVGSLKVTLSNGCSGKFPPCDLWDNFKHGVHEIILFKCRPSQDLFVSFGKMTREIIPSWENQDSHSSDRII